MATISFIRSNSYLEDFRDILSLFLFLSLSLKNSNRYIDVDLDLF